MGLTDSCLALGNMYLVGSGEIPTPRGLVILTCSPLGVEKSVETALELYSKYCEEGSMGACNNAGLVWQTSRGEQPPDHSKAEEYTSDARVRVASKMAVLISASSIYAMILPRGRT